MLNYEGVIHFIIRSSSFNIHYLFYDDADQINYAASVSDMMNHAPANVINHAFVNVMNHAFVNVMNHVPTRG